MYTQGQFAQQYKNAAVGSIVREILIKPFKNCPNTFKNFAEVAKFRTWLNRWKFRGREISRRREMKKITSCQMQKSWWKIWGKIPNYPQNFYWNSIIPIEISLNYFAGYFLKGKILPRNFYKVTWYNNSDWNFAEIFCSRWQHFGEHFTTKFVSEILIKCAFYFGRNFAEIFCHCSNLAQ